MVFHLSRSVDQMPNTHWIAPQLFIACMESSTIKSEDLAILLINEIASDTPDSRFTRGDDSADMPEPHSEIHQLLACLWATSQGLVSAVKLEDLPDSDAIDGHCDMTKEGAKRFLLEAPARRNPPRPEEIACP